MKRNYINPQLICIPICDVVATSNPLLNRVDEGNEDNINFVTWKIDT